MVKPKNNNLNKDKVEHKIVSYFILRKLAQLLPLNIAKKLTRLLMTSKELLDKMGLGNYEKEDIKANEKGIKQASEDIINRKPYRYKIGAGRLIKNLLKYLNLED